MTQVDSGLRFAGSVVWMTSAAWMANRGRDWGGESLKIPLNIGESCGLYWETGRVWGSHDVWCLSRGVFPTKGVQQIPLWKSRLYSQTYGPFSNQVFKNGPHIHTWVSQICANKHLVVLYISLTYSRPWVFLSIYVRSLKNWSSLCSHHIIPFTTKNSSVHLSSHKTHLITWIKNLS